MADYSEAKKAKGRKKCVTENMLKFNDYKIVQSMLKPQQRFKSEAHNVCTEEVNKIALSSKDDKRLQTYDGIMAYPYGYKGWKSM